MNTVWVTMIPTVQVITVHQHMMLKDLPVHSHSCDEQDLESSHDHPGERKCESSDVHYVCHEHSPAYYEHYHLSESHYSASTSDGKDLQVHNMNTAMIIMYIMNTVWVTMNTIASIITVHQVHLIINHIM